MTEPRARPQGTTDADVAATRVPRSVVFLIAVLGYGLALTFYRPTGQDMPGQGLVGGLIFGFGLVLATQSYRGMHVRNPLRQIALGALVLLLSWSFAWAIIQGRPQTAVLLAHLTGICWIEAWLALRVTRRTA